ncbi:MAG: ATP-dependent helicase HrpB [Actinomycetota bacterium]
MSRVSDTGLPIESVVEEIRAGLADQQRLVLTAEPGAGKTTVVPLRLLDEPWLRGRRIVMLEPRRLAARASAARMADLLGESVGATVGVTTRDDRRVGRDTRIEVVTEGILTRRLQNDPSLDGVGLVIFDEFHERSQHADLGLGLLLDAQRGLGLDIALMVMSATIDADRVAELIGEDNRPAPVVACAGRTHPVEVHWRPRNRRDKLEIAVAAAVEWVVHEQPEGDVLVFLPGMAEIRRVQEQLRRLDPRFVVHVLHGSLPLDEQDRAVAPAPLGLRKIVLSTDIAESSLTVEGVTAVVDSGQARSPRFDAGTGLTRLTTISVSRASADQRTGRAGRVRPGIGVRLWSKIEHGTRPAFSPPELSQVDLADARLELAAWGVREPDVLSLLDPIPAPAWNESGEVLRLLGAIDVDGSITSRGRRLAELPLHPRLGAIVVRSIDEGLGAMGCAIAALLDERDILRGRPGEVPTGLGTRLELLRDRTRNHAQANGRAIGMTRDRAEQLARRVRVDREGWDLDRAGLLVAAGFPDRLAQRRGKNRGRFRLRTGSGIQMAPNDELAGEEFIVALDVDGQKKDARIRIAAAADVTELSATGEFPVDRTERLIWDKQRNDVVLRIDQHLGALELGSVTMRPEPSDAVTNLLIEHVRRSRLKALTWTDNARSMQQRIGFLAERRPDDGWPDVSDHALLGSLAEWLAPLLAGASGRSALDVLSVTVALDTIVGHGRRHELDRAVPTHFTLPNGRRLTIDYSGEHPVVRSRAQDFYGVREQPSILDGRQPITVELLSPANRPIQRTSDLPGFWSGSWAEVRKDMAGRYPKHDWPVDPTA